MNEITSKFHWSLVSISGNCFYIAYVFEVKEIWERFVKMPNMDIHGGEKQQRCV